ncbi:hypothetical protein TNCV_3974241 [Trichonephila clavipes]|nr:hypothetical protein TNCV_3974241 [Trichonephila clavipes]
MKSVANSSTLWKQFTETDCRPVCRPGQGHKKARESVQDRYLRLLAERDSLNRDQSRVLIRDRQGNRDEIFAFYCRLFCEAYGPNFLMDNNARKHRAQLEDEYLQSEDIQRLE